MAKRKSKRSAAPPASTADTYRHPTADLPTRPEVGTQAQFKNKKPTKQYRYDASLAPDLNWDGQNPGREQAESLLRRIQDARTVEEARAAAGEIARLSRPFLNWSGKAERLSFDVPTLPLFVHERLSTKAILETLKRHSRDQQEILDLFGDPRRSITDQVLRAYEHRDKWVNRLILGDSLVVMNSLLEYEGLGGQVQMIYIDPPYGVKFGSNFQPFVRKRDVKHNDDADLTREPEMVQAYRDTWELGLHSYLSYLRDRLLVARDLLSPSGSVFVQISEDNLHHTREVMDDVFAETNYVATIVFGKTSGLFAEGLNSVCDFLLWYARDRGRVRISKLFKPRGLEDDVGERYTRIQLPDGSRRAMTTEERSNPTILPTGSRPFSQADLTSARPTGTGDLKSYTFDGIVFKPGKRTFRTNLQGLDRLAAANRLAYPTPNSLRFVRYLGDFPFGEVTNVWLDTLTGAFTDDKLYVVQTNAKVIGRCIQMTTDPGDLVLDPTCGSGTTAYVAEQWGRRWITIDTSRVPLALARQRLLTATFPWYELKDDKRGPTGGFVYKRKQNSKGEDIGGIVPHITLKSIANDEPPAEEVLVDRPEEVRSVTRVTGPFVVEATIPTPVDFEGDGVEDSGAVTSEEYGSFVERMLEVLRRNPILQVGGGKSVTLRNVRPPAKSLSISAEAVVDAGGGRPVAIVFGPENGAVSEKLVYNACKEANARNYTHLYVIGFSIQPNARELIENAESAIGIPATYVAVTPDVSMGDLLKTMRSSQIFSVCGLPEIEIERVKKKDKSDPDRYRVRLLGLDTFDPVTMEAAHLDGVEVPAWFLDSNYDELCFRVTQAFFPRTGAWDNLRRALRASYEDSVWDHLEGAESAEFEAEKGQKVAVKVIDDRGNELMVVKGI